MKKKPIRAWAVVCGGQIWHLHPSLESAQYGVKQHRTFCECPGSVVELVEKGKCRGGMCLMVPATKRGTKGPYKCRVCGARAAGLMEKKGKE